MRVQLDRKSKKDITFPALVILKSNNAVLLVKELPGEKQQYSGMYITGPNAGDSYGLVPLENSDQFDVLQAGDEVILIQE